MKETIHFYENIIGLKKTAEWPNYVTFDAGGFDLAFELGGKKGGKISHKEGAPDLFMEVDDVDDVYRKPKENCVKFVSEPKDQTWSARTATFLDLDENRFILVHLKRAQAS